MVCIYCGSDTQVINSRLQKRANSVWRRRRCTGCKAVFTTQESIELGTSLVVQYADNAMAPFSRDKLFVSVLQACDQLPDPFPTAAALTSTSVNKIMKQIQEGQLTPEIIARSTATVLKRFQPLLAVRYASMHSEWFDAKKLARGLL